ncbi:endonuclease-8 [Parafrankia irregularis]|uniref:DNA-(apurinic or apyrimidinic site) lyase n=1 Tax=Parafrankia irregularis TaxID=795642 RepID=A0A0S4QJD2_9ACTN|nr:MULTISPECIES: DNA-formamidopyrimidine glycosylase family protein [Parafrankia]MBE3205488.1 Fpg/Nei family DNA glycosylase [Parafrankia sp. CH37]CUU55616.1 endonuclease-8 [Parafrankia irregularis]
MPEGDTVWLTARRLDAALRGQRLLRSDFRVPSLATADLRGREVLEVCARGKHLLLRVDGGLTLHTHLRMEGSWHLYRPGSRWSGGPAWQIRVVLVTAVQVAVGYRLPVVDLLPTASEDRVVGHLGPDVLGADWDLDRAVANLLADPAREIGVALLDQRVLAGLGNIWRTEACFLAGVSPWTPVGEVRDLPGLVRRAQAMVRAGARGGHQVTTGSARPGEQHWVYGRAGRPCRRCGTLVRRLDRRVSTQSSSERGSPGRSRGPGERGTRLDVRRDQGRHADGAGGSADVRVDVGGGNDRVTAWCPTCQPGPVPEPPAG